MYELERKARADHRAIRGRLRELDVAPTAALVQEDTYMNHPGRDFAETDEALRIRRQHPIDDPESATIELTYKGPRLDEDEKTRVERSTTAGNDAELVAILEALGFEPVDVVAKHRTRYEYNGVTICLDEVEGLGEFVELEAETADEAFEPVTDRIDQVSATLGIDAHEAITTPYLTMLLGEHTEHQSAEGHDTDRASRSP